MGVLLLNGGGYEPVMNSYEPSYELLRLPFSQKFTLAPSHTLPQKSFS